MPRIRIRDASNTLRTITRIRMRDSTNTLRTILRIRMRDAGNVLRTVYQAVTMTVNCVPPAVSGSDGSSVLIASIDTNSATAVVNDGTAPFTYQWTQTTSNSGLSWTINAPTAASTFFTALSVPQGIYEETFAVQVTDSSVPANVVTRFIVATIANTNTS